MASWIMRWAIIVEQALTRMLRQLRVSEEGQGLVEYSLILVLIAVLVLISVKFLQPAINVAINQVANSF